MRPWPALIVALLLAAGCTSSPDPADLGPEREEAEARVQALGPDAWQLGDALAEAHRDVCQEGQQNWKVDETGFQCTVGRSWVLPGAASRADVEDALDAMSARLDDLGCEPVGRDGLTKTVRYWTEGVTQDAGGLPSERFTCDGTRVEVAPVSATETRLTPISLVGDLTGGDVGPPDEQPFAADVEQQVAGTGDALLWQVTVASTYGAQE